MGGARVPLLGAAAAVFMLCGATGADARSGIVGFGFGFSPWWGPYDAFAPPAYAYPPPIYSVPPPPPPPASLSRAMPNSALGGCRELESTVIVDGQPRLARGLACPQSDGTWRIVR